MAYSVPSTHQIVSGGPIQFAFDQSSASLSIGSVGQTVRTDDGKEFTLYKYKSSGVAAYAGGPAVLSNSTAAYVCTSDTSDGDAGGHGGIGVFCASQANQDAIYLWVQTKGDVNDARVASTVAAGDLIYVGASELFEAVDDNFKSTVDTLYRGIAVAKEAAGGTGVSTADIQLL